MKIQGGLTDRQRLTQERAIRAALRVVLPTAPVDLRPVGDAWTVRVADANFTTRWVRYGWLAEVREALNADPAPDLVVGPTISPGGRDALKRAGAGWLEARTGAARFIGGNVVVITDAILKDEDLTRPGSWTPATLAVCEALLTGTAPTVQAVTDRTRMASGSASMALSLLARRNLLESGASRGRGSGRILTDPRGLLEAYSDAAQLLTSNTRIRVGVLWRDPEALREVAGDLDRSHVSWAATGDLAAALMAPFATNVSTWKIYVAAQSRAELVQAAQAIGAEPADGGRLTLETFPARWSAELRENVDGIWCAPWPRVFADLRTTGVRGEDAAEHLAEQYLNVPTEAA